jgi:RNA polymerase sigma factor (sigma-70 family)
MLPAMEAREGQGLAQAVRRVSAGVRGVANGDTEDCVQEALARAIKSGVSLEAEQWLKTVAKRVAIDVHRRRREYASGAPTDLENHAPVLDADPQDIYLRAERARTVREALDALPPRYRKVLQAYAEEDSPAAVATRLGMSASATWTLLSRARSRLRLQLEQVGFVPAMVSVARGRWRGLAAAGAAAAAAATVAFVPGPSSQAPVAKPAAPKVTNVVADTVAAAAVRPKVVLPAAAGDLTKTVTEAADDQLDAVKAPQVSVSTCFVGLAEQPASVQLSLDKSPAVPGLLSKVVERVPEEVRTLGPKTCAPSFPARLPLP